ncbi:RNA-binding S4 domain-containing protein [Pseudomarimonas salicorniae]|uniref:Heat shock protein 15 n=1 Tax=Pseudomarimonas salicorniae TaxID=2933270 RepID=A0ABT0GMW3_9GAMM|nr:RNA-binding S4 domain-containing protein [Lysobacter sp. CAU 1642]
MSGSPLTEARIDQWLWAARFFKTRSLAKQAVENGKVAIGGQTVGKPSRCVRVGDALCIDRAGERYEVEVLGLSTIRGPAPVAQALYSESDEARLRREAARAERRAAEQGFQPPPQRPDKRGRRRLQDLQKGDGLPPWWPR